MWGDIAKMAIALRDSKGRFTPGHKNPAEYRKKISDAMKGRKHKPGRPPRPKGLKYHISPEGRANMERGLKLGRGWNKGIPMSEEQKLKVSLSVRQAAIEGRCKPPLPTRLEQWIQFVLEDKYPGEWEYTGDGKVTIEGYCPDFINVDGKKIVIEAFGSYWHNEEQAKARRRTFAKYGYITVIIWEVRSNNYLKRLPPKEEIIELVKQGLTDWSSKGEN